MHKVLICFLLLLSCSCTPKTNKTAPSIQELGQQTSDPAQRDKVLQAMGNTWLYGNGIGETILAAGTVFLFPPSAIYFLGNSALDLSGYEPLHLSNALPEEPKAKWNAVYDGVTSGPGRLSAAIAGKEFLTRERASEEVNNALNLQINSKLE